MTPYCPQSPTGAHHWQFPPHKADDVDISRPAREPGTCRWCGAERTFTNALRSGVNWGTVKAAKRGGVARAAR